MKIIRSKRQPPNLKKILARAKLTTQENIDNVPKVRKCNDKRCETSIALPQYRKLFVNKHIAECAGSISPKFTICPFSKLHNQDENFRKEKESYSIPKYQPKLNR